MTFIFISYCIFFFVSILFNNYNAVGKGQFFQRAGRDRAYDSDTIFFFYI